MFDYFRSSYDIGKEFTDVELQTKDIEDYISGTMTFYWIDPVGRLWKPNYIGTNTFEEIKETDERYNDKIKFLNFEWIPTGTHGKYSPVKITKYIKAYPSCWKGEWKDWPTVRLHFVDGMLKGFVDVTGVSSDY